MVRSPRNKWESEGLNDIMKERAVSALAAATIWLMILPHRKSLEGQARGAERGSNALSKETRAILDESEKFVLISLEPDWITEEQRKTDKRQTFHRYPILGQTEIKDAKLKRKLVAALYAATEEYRKPGLNAPAPSCFNPRHGIRAMSGTNWVELVICFQCEQVVEYRKDGEDWTMLSKEPTALFNRTLKEAGVALPKH